VQPRVGLVGHGLDAVNERRQPGIGRPGLPLLFVVSVRVRRLSSSSISAASKKSPGLSGATRG
jgi:hypothetical protein